MDANKGHKRGLQIANSHLKKMFNLTGNQRNKLKLQWDSVPTTLVEIKD